MGLSFHRQAGVGYAIYAAALLLLLLATSQFKTTYSDFQLVNLQGQSQQIEWPYLAQTPRAKAAYSFVGKMHLGFFSPRSYRIIPDDIVQHIIVNGQSVDLSEVPKERLSDVNRGFTLNLSAYLKTGTNDIKITVWDYGGMMGANIKTAYFDTRAVLLVLSWLALLSIVFIQAMKMCHVPRWHALMYFLVILGAVCQVWNIFVYNPVDHIFSDPARHWEQGIDVLRIDVMSVTDPIVYQLYIAFLAKLTLKLPGLVAFFTSLLAVITPWIWYKFFRELQSNKLIALAGWAFLSLLPSWMAIYSYFMQETLMLPLMGAALWATWRCRRKNTVSAFSLMVFLWVLAGLTRGVSIPMAAVCCTWLWFEQDNKWRKALYSTTILVLILGPLTYRSYQTVNHFAPHGMGHLNVIYSRSGKKTIQMTTHRGGARWGHGFGSPSTGAKPFYPFSDWKTQRTGTVRINIDLDKGTEDWNKEKSKINMTWSDYGWILKENLIFLFFAESWPDNNWGRIVDSLNSIMRFIWAPLLIVTLAWLIYRRKIMARQWMLPSMILMWFVVQAVIPISVNEGRYRKPFEGLVIAQMVLLAGLSRGGARIPIPTGITIGEICAYVRRLREQANEVSDSVQLNDIPSQASDNPKKAEV